MPDRPFALYRSAPSAAGGLSVTGIGRHRVTQAINIRKLPEFAVVLVEDGQGWLETKAFGVQTVTAPALFWLFPGKTHSYGPDASGWLERWALFDGALTRDFTRLRLIAEDAPVVPLHDLSEMQRLFDRLHSELSLDTVLSQAEAAATMHGIVVRAARQAADRSNRERDPGLHGAADIRPIIDELRRCACDPIDLDVFAAKFGMSPATMRRRFALATGMSPKAFQLRIRLDRAKQMLAGSDSSIESIAAAVGIHDAFYFSRLFRDRENCSPSEFRSRHNRR
ncbi:AraC family transcriptional regulator [Mesorhizobium sp. WSM4303]|uniref:helix-turn-helix domain-containing protein n=1 Tax=unclassified Mesorhizobium TaxID=325217 RepID=UPI00115E0134|nr:MULTISPECIES: AraC family transcriptional regulator [unclassified Mesorhizobium]TRC92750.1 AraC family transcriptional regulator [Mesorhizobium sp. WSM4306]TRD01253.1 AraC family transcriptional regulator [Mesorhizobium sp. WSM4303]